VRENGGQYTHAAIWTAMAFALLGDHAYAWQLFAMLNPVSHGDCPEAIARYRVEPYVMAADLYGAPPHTGRGGWNWYTGAAGWMYRLAVETLLGLERHPDHLRLNPRLPSGVLERFALHYRVGEHFYHIAVEAGPPGAGVKVTLDGTEQADGRIPLLYDGRDHQAMVRCGRSA
jgi:cellobiose phosphorylase